MDTPSAASQNWIELAGQWQALGTQWAQWWTHAMIPPGMPGTGAALSPPVPSIPPMALLGLFDPQICADLTAKYQPRFQALWEAANAALLAGPAGAATLPAVALPVPGDRRFAARVWNEIPYFAFMKQGYLLTGEFLKELAERAPLPEPDRKRLQFLTRQYVDALAPVNFPATNPEVIERALSTEGASVVAGLSNLVADAQKGRISMSDERAFAVGKNLAVTPGEVVFRNELIELIQYAPTTARVHARPLVIVPPWINKYYILDLQPENSFVRHAVAQGHTVFTISWRNIPPELGQLTWDDYIEQGALEAIRVARAITGASKVNALGFCIGGTLLACTLAVLAARRDSPVESATFLTTMLDFTDPGEIGVYISREQLAKREAALMAGERVRGSELAGAFASLRANELVWNYVVHNYLKGQTPPAFDLLFWNGDSTNLPGPMYVYYLRNMYLDNRLREPGALSMAGAKVDLRKIRVPAFVYASRDDHIVPWSSAYRTLGLLGGDARFVLGASGHIAGVVNPPEKHRRNFWTNGAVEKTAEHWFDGATSHPGSWWPDWASWLAPHGGAMKAAPARAGNTAHPPLEPAPGRYVRDAA